MTFEEILALLQNPGEDGLPEDIWDQLSGVHNDAVSRHDGAVATIAERDATIAELAGKLVEAQAHNYELLMAVGDGSDNSEESESSDDGDISDGIDSPWTVKED